VVVADRPREELPGLHAGPHSETGRHRRAARVRPQFSGRKFGEGAASEGG
jgi:hypothetical protein